MATQTSTEFEHIIVDGASTDDSVDIIREYSQSPTAICYKITWCSEPDSGIYNAMNKGIEIALGRRVVNSINHSLLAENQEQGVITTKRNYLLFLNSGDILVDENVVCDFLKSDKKEDIVAGGILQGFNNLQPKYPPQKLTFELFVNDSLMHPATFIRRDLFERYGLYNEQHKIVSDWEFFIKVLINNNCTYTTIDRLISVFDTTGISNQSAYSILHVQERNEVINDKMPYLKPVYDELMERRQICNEYKFLKDGRLGCIIELCLKLKSMKRK